MTSSTLKPGQSLAEKRPDLAAQWHPTRNGDLSAASVTPGSDRKIWWLCPEDDEHEWQAAVGSRTAGTGCPFCSGRRATRSNNLAVTHPALAAEWHPTLNGDLSPAAVSPGSDRKVWWLCPVDEEHAWQTTVGSRARGSGCPFCAGQRATSSNSLAASHPLLAAEWHPTLNGAASPGDYLAGSHAVVWWQCREDPEHEWRAQVGSRSGAGRGCPFCAGQRATPRTCLSATRPDLAAQWHPTLNGDLTPDDVLPRSNRRIWWKCDAGPDHEWQTTVNSRSSGVGCPACAGYQVSSTNSLASLRPDLAAQWHPTLNGGLTPADVVAGARRVVWWKCDAGPDHEWRSQLTTRSARPTAGCIFCAGQRASVTNSLETRRPDLAAQWHPTRNGTVTPSDVASGSTKRVWWLCPTNQDHEWQTSVVQRTVTGSGCPRCAEYGYNPAKPGTLYVLCGDDWGKVGISNVLIKRLAQHASGGAFGTFRIALEFADGTVPQRLEKALCAFITERTDERAAVGIDGYTESFPAWLLEDVLAELRRLLEELPTWERGRLVPSGYRLET